MATQLNFTRQAAVNSDGTWSASNVPVSSRGTASLNVGTYPAGSNPSTTPADGGQFSIQAQPAQVVLASYEYNSSAWRNTHLTDQDVPDGNGGVEHVAQDCWMPTTDNTSEFWVRGLGGAYQSSWQYLNAYHLCASGVVDNGPYSHSIDGGSPECNNYGGSGGDSGGLADVVTWSQSANATMALDTGGAGQVGTTALYLVQAQVYDEDTDEQLAAGAVRFVNQMAGTTTEDVTNDVGAVWSQALVSVPAGMTNVAVTPIAAGDISFTGMKIGKMVYFYVDSSGKPSSFRASDVQNLLQTELNTNVFDNLPDGSSVQIMVDDIHPAPKKLGWDSAKQTYINHVDWTTLSGIPAKRDGNGGIQICDEKIEEFAAPYITQNVGAQTWVNIFAHEGIWGNAANKGDCEIFCTDGEISVGSGFYSAYLFAKYTVALSSRATIRSRFGF